MEDRIIKEKGDRDIATIKSLSLDNCKSSNVVGLTEDWKGLENLNLVNVGLTTLKGFPRLPGLKKLELSDNNICEGLDALACLPKLEELNLSGNKVKDIEVFESLADLDTLKRLNLFGCDICKTKNYREDMFELIPSLVQLDGKDKYKKIEKKNGASKPSAADSTAAGDSAGEEEEDEDECLDEEEVDDEEDEEEEGDEEEGGIPLQALYDSKMTEGDDDDDFEAGDDEVDDEEIDEQDEDEGDASIVDAEADKAGGRGTKRKHEDEEED